MKKIDAQKRAIQAAVLTLKAISEPGTLPPPDAHLCKVMAEGCLVRIRDALNLAQLPMPYEAPEKVS